jgi:hypothetical protein
VLPIKVPGGYYISLGRKEEGELITSIFPEDSLMYKTSVMLDGENNWRNVQPGHRTGDENATRGCCAEGVWSELNRDEMV